MFLKVVNTESKETYLALIAINGIRLYSTSEDSGLADITIANSDFIDCYEIIGLVDDEVNC